MQIKIEIFLKFCWGLNALTASKPNTQTMYCGESTRLVTMEIKTASNAMSAGLAEFNLPVTLQKKRVPSKAKPTKVITKETIAVPEATTSIAPN
jgi:hypothetical protein